MSARRGVRKKLMYAAVWCSLWSVTLREWDGLLYVRLGATDILYRKMVACLDAAAPIEQGLGLDAMQLACDAGEEPRIVFGIMGHICTHCARGDRLLRSEGWGR